MSFFFNKNKIKQKIEKKEKTKKLNMNTLQRRQVKPTQQRRVAKKKSTERRRRLVVHTPVSSFPSSSTSSSSTTTTTTTTTTTVVGRHTLALVTTKPRTVVPLPASSSIRKSIQTQTKIKQNKSIPILKNQQGRSSIIPRTFSGKKERIHVSNRLTEDNDIMFQLSPGRTRISQKYKQNDVDDDDVKVSFTKTVLKGVKGFAQTQTVTLAMNAALGLLGVSTVWTPLLTTLLLTSPGFISSYRNGEFHTVLKERNAITGQVTDIRRLDVNKFALAIKGIVLNVAATVLNKHIPVPEALKDYRVVAALLRAVTTSITIQSLDAAGTSLYGKLSTTTTKQQNLAEDVQLHQRLTEQINRQAQASNQKRILKYIQEHKYEYVANLAVIAAASALSYIISEQYKNNNMENNNMFNSYLKQFGPGALQYIIKESFNQAETDVTLLVAAASSSSTTYNNETIQALINHQASVRFKNTLGKIIAATDAKTGGLSSMVGRTVKQELGTVFEKFCSHICFE